MWGSFEIQKGIQYFSCISKYFRWFNGTALKKKPKKIRFGQVSEFYNSSSKDWLEDNDTKMYLTYVLNEKKSVDAERFVKT